MMDVSNDFNRGYACAISCIVKGHGPDTSTLEALEANGMTSLKKLHLMGVDPYDIDVLRPLIQEIKRKRGRKKK